MQCFFYNNRSAFRFERISRDVADLQKISDFFYRYGPFPGTENIISIYSGIVGDEDIKCYKEREVGEKSVKLIIENIFGSIQFKR